MNASFSSWHERNSLVSTPGYKLAVNFTGFRSTYVTNRFYAISCMQLLEWATAFATAITADTPTNCAHKYSRQLCKYIHPPTVYIPINIK